MILVGGIPIPLKNDGVRQIGSSSQLLGKIKFMFQTTNQDMLTELKVFLQETIVLTKKIKKPTPRARVNLVKR